MSAFDLQTMAVKKRKKNPKTLKKRSEKKGTGRYFEKNLSALCLNGLSGLQYAQTSEKT